MIQCLRASHCIAAGMTGNDIVAAAMTVPIAGRSEPIVVPHGDLDKFVR
jgi:hypothetical protein